MKRDKRYTFVAHPLFIALCFTAMLGSALYISTTAPALYSIASTGFTAALIYNLNNRFFSFGKNSLTVAFLYLLLVYSSPVNIYFSNTTIVAPLLLLTLFYTLKTNKGQAEQFYTGFFFSIATLLDFRLLPLIPFILYFSVTGSSFSARSIFMFLISLLIPYIFTFSVRYIFFDDVSLFWSSIIASLGSFSSPVIKVNNVAEALLIIMILYITIRAIYTLLNSLSRYKSSKSASITRSIIIAIVLTIIMLIYRENQPAFMHLIAIPLSFILSEYLTHPNTNRFKRVEFLVFIVFLVVTRAAEFI